MKITSRLIVAAALVALPVLAGCGSRYESEKDTIKELESYGNLLELENASRGSSQEHKN